MTDEIKCLDHGYVRLIETWGSDERIVEAARMSTGKGFTGWGPLTKYECPEHGPVDAGDVYEGESGGHGHRECWKTVKATPGAMGDEKLLKFLWDNKHATPFEMGGAIIEVQAPIFVFREWHRHRTQSYNEMSARYTPLPDVNYVPTVERLMTNSKTNKQAGVIKGAEELTEGGAVWFIRAIKAQYADAQLIYEQALRSGVPKELARVHLPVGRYSRMRASANLRNWLAFLTLRMAPAAQWEIREYANAVGEFVKQAFPRTYSLFESAGYK